ncbi:MAG: ABC transporter permease [Phycisphaerae bacterium]
MTTAVSQSTFPISQAFLFALQGVRLRLGRMLLVLAGVTVAIAFVGVLWSTDDMFNRLPKSVLEQAQGQTRVRIFQQLWVYVALLICCVGIFNAVVMSVTERIKEIGTLKCLGSRNIHVVEIFLFESLLLGLIGGVLGGALGYGVAILNFINTVGSRFLNSEVASGALGNILWCVGIGVGLSLLASVVPVLMATKVEPAAAMRYEV